MKIYYNDFNKGFEEILENKPGFQMNEFNEIPFEQLFTQKFMNYYTEFDSFEGLLEASQWKVGNQNSFEVIPEDEFDDYIDQCTVFPTWKIMYQTAASLFLEQHLY